jgi:hypothetical protein
MAPSDPGLPSINMACFVSGIQELRDDLRSGLVVAVDLGFAERDETCGLAWRCGAAPEEAASTTFGGCIRRIAELVTAAEARAALIIEAPLSGCFNADGNPMARDYGETRANGRSLESGRGWYCGAGAIVALGAVFFLRRLRDALGKSDATIVLFEGFVSFKRKKSEHVDDARKLLEMFVGNETRGYTVRAPARGEMITSLEVLGEKAQGAPLVLIPPRPEPDRRGRRRQRRSDP